MKDTRLSNITLILFSITLAVMAACAICFSLLSETDSLVYQIQPQEPLSQEWILNGRETITFPKSITLGKQDKLTLSCRLPAEIHPHEALFYNVCYSAQEVLVDDKLIWSFATTPQLPFSSMRGSTYALIDLSPDYAGKTLTIIMTNPYNTTNYNFEGVYLGDKGEFKFILLRQNMWRVTVFILFTFLALLSLIYGVYSRFSKVIQTGTLPFIYFALMVFSVGLWILCDPSITQFYTSKTTLVQFLSLLSLLNIGSNYMGLCSCFMHNQSRTFHLLENVGYVLILGTILLYITGLYTPVDLLAVICFYAFTTLVVSLFIFVRYHREYDFSGIIIVGIVVLITGVSITIVQFLSDPSGTKAVMSFSISFGLYIMCLFVILVKNAIAIIKKSSESQMYHHLALTDYLTNIPNRAAFERRMDEILHNENVTGTATLIMCDLNYLKRTNDMLGHDAGDKMIQGAATCLRSVFGDQCYRVGGDEFAAISLNSALPIAELLHQLEQQIDMYNQENSVPLSIAVGYATRTLPLSETEHSADFYREADNHMYENKKKMCAQRK